MESSANVASQCSVIQVKPPSNVYHTDFNGAIPFYGYLYYSLYIHRRFCISQHFQVESFGVFCISYVIQGEVLYGMRAGGKGKRRGVEGFRRCRAGR